LECAAGKAVNVAKVLKSLGEHPVLTGFLGGVRGEILKTQLQDRGIELAFVPVAAQTRQCLTVIDEAAGTQTELVEESQRVRASDYEALEAFVRRRIAQCRAIILSGSLTPGGPQDFYSRCVKLAHEHGVLSVVDAQGAPLAAALKAKPGLVKPNRTELGATVGRVLATEAEVMSGMRELQARGAQRVVVTAGSQPTLAFDGQDFWRITPPKIVAKNPIGSGDAFTAGLAWRSLRGDDLGEACRWATAAGAANALTLLPGEVEPTHVRRLIRSVKAEQI
jgi:tagatose 6-phosphate kinase